MTADALTLFDAPVFHGRIIGRCPVKGCKQARAINADGKRTRRINNRFGGYDVTVPVYRLPDGRETEWFEYLRHVAPTCPDHHGKRLKFVEVDGSFDPDTRCNGACLHARGPRCECNCGGANHGAGHL